MGSTAQALNTGRSRRPERYRPAFYGFAVLNTFSFMLLSGGVITIIALAMGASGTVVGILGSLGYLTYFFMPIGRWAIRRARIVGVFGWSWLFRYLGMAPAVAAPLLAAAGAPATGLAVLVAGSFFFNFFRGTGLIGNNPVMAFMAGQRGRGAFLSNVQILNSLTAIGTSALIALSLSRYQGSLTYALLLAGGVVLGIIGSLILLGLPEPEEYRPPEGSSLGKTIRAAFKDGNFRRYVWVLCPLAFAAGTARTFIVTHARALYGQSDGMVMLYSVAFNLGIVFMGFLSRRLMDRLGAKPLYAVFGAIAALAMLPLVWSPLLDGGLSTTLFLLAVNFLAGFGIAGQENAGQAYFFSIIGRDQVMDLAVVYFVVLGLGGTLGSALGGVFLDALSSAGVPAQLSYRLLYSTVLVIIALASMGIGGLASLGSASVRQSLGVMFNLRDLKAISLLDRLGKTRSPLEEAEVIREIGSRGSALSEAELLPYLANPRFDLRVEALLALENLDRLSQKTLTALCGELKARPWSTAYLAARILGKRGHIPALPLLRDALDSDDYMLASAAAMALARLGDSASREKIEAIADATDNPRLLMSSVTALEVLDDPASMPALVSILRRREPPSYAFDEIVLALGGMLERRGGISLGTPFYRVYADWLREPDEGIELLAERAERGERPLDDTLAGDIDPFVRSGERSSAMARAIAEASPLGDAAGLILSDACLDLDLAGHSGFRFLLAAVAISSFSRGTSP